MVPKEVPMTANDLQPITVVKKMRKDTGKLSHTGEKAKVNFAYRVLWYLMHFSVNLQKRLWNTHFL